jgi:hypothetical protein
VGRASKRKQAQRQAGPSARRARPDSRSSTVPPQLSLLDDMVEMARVRVERQYAAREVWSGDAEPVPAELPEFPEDSLGDRFLAGYLGEAQDAPSLLTTGIPDVAVIAADSAQWNIAVLTLIRSVVFEGLTLDHPAVTALLEVLAPIVAAEQAHWEDGADGFPELDGPVYSLGARALVEATRAAVGQDLLKDVLDVLLPALDDAVPGVKSLVLGIALVGALPRHYSFDDPADTDVLEHMGPLPGNALETLVATGAVPPEDVLSAGLRVLSVLARLCLTDADSILSRT